MINLPAVVLGESKPIQPSLIESTDVATLASESSFSIALLWYVGVAFFGGLLVFKLLKIWRFKQSCKAIQKQGYSIVMLNNSEDAFSFWNHIFLGDRLESTQKESILKHEKVHVQEKHTLDLLWFEILRIVFWFNPLVYLYQKRITEVHEFIADKCASKQQHNYYENLLAKTFNIAQFSVVNQFYSSSLIKKRIIMLTKEKSNKTKLVKYITIIPIVLGMLVYVSCTDALEIENTTETALSSETTVLEDVYRIVNKELPNDTNESDISDEIFEKISKKIKDYSVENKSKIEATDLNKYLLYSMMLEYEKKALMDYTDRDWEIEVFKIGENCVNTLLKRRDFLRESDFKNAMSKLTSRMFKINKLEELNFVLPNENEIKELYEKKGKALYEEYLKNVKEGTVPNFEGEVSFKILDQAPIYPGCDESATLEALKKCFSMGIAKHINENFNTDIAKTHNLIGRQKIYIAFKVDEQGNLKDITARGPHEALVAEAKRVMSSLPALKPGIHNGKAVTVKYSIPVIIMVNQ